LTVVALDRPGLLAIIGLAFDACELDIMEAEVFTRRLAGLEDEAVDLFWVRLKGSASMTKLLPVEIRQIRDTLARLLQRAPKELLPPVDSGYRTPASTGTLVRFLEDIAGRFSTLEIETNDRSGLMLGVCQALFHEEIQIVGSRIKTDAGRVKGRFEVTELTERPIEQARRHVIKLAVLHAIDNLSRDTIAQMVG
jgi:UTP:GlnB (protein PII) uridylyltransferase